MSDMMTGEMSAIDGIEIAEMSEVEATTGTGGTDSMIEIPGSEIGRP